jgi:hypothetical protein
MVLKLMPALLLIHEPKENGISGTCAEPHTKDDDATSFPKTTRMSNSKPMQLLLTLTVAGLSASSAPITSMLLSLTIPSRTTTYPFGSIRSRTSLSPFKQFSRRPHRRSFSSQFREIRRGGGCSSERRRAGLGGAKTPMYWR